MLYEDQPFNHSAEEDDSTLRNQTIKILSIQQPEKLEEDDIGSPRESEQSVTVVNQDAQPRKGNKQASGTVIKISKKEITFAKNTNVRASKKSLLK